MKEIHFLKSVYDLSQLPKTNLPQLVLCGRSNVGKSSFINSIYNRKSIAKTSSTPGKTRSINFYNVENEYLVVDLPGFGFAKTSLAERKKWGTLISNYIEKTKAIRHSFHFIDCRHKPTELDIQLNFWLKAAGIDYSVILSKADKLKQSQLHKTVKEVISIFPELHLNENLFLYSSVEGKWKRPLQKRMNELFF